MWQKPIARCPVRLSPILIARSDHFRDSQEVSISASNLTAGLCVRRLKKMKDQSKVQWHLGLGEMLLKF